MEDGPRTYFAELLLASSLLKDEFHPWFQSVFLNNPSWTDFFCNLVLFRVDIDQVTWSMLPEVIWSLLLPAAAFVHFKSNLPVRVALLLLITIIGQYSDRDYVQFASTFYAGFFVPREILIPILTRHRFAGPLVALSGWIILCFGNRLVPGYSPPMRLCCMVGAVLVVSGVASAGRGLHILEVAPLRLLGRVSYSFYLLHLPSLFVLACLVGSSPTLKPESMAGAMALGIGSILLSIGLSYLCYWFVEVPGIGAGKKLSELVRFSPTRFQKYVTPSATSPETL